MLHESPGNQPCLRWQVFHWQTLAGYLPSGTIEDIGTKSSGKVPTRLILCELFPCCRGQTATCVCGGVTESTDAVGLCILFPCRPSGTKAS